MKVGSIVECVKLNQTPGCQTIVDIKVGGIYTVNWVRQDWDGLYLGFEETLQEQCYGADQFREIEFPPAIEAEINEALTAPVKTFA